MFEPVLDQYVRTELVLSELGLPPDVAGDLVHRVPLPELHRVVLEVIEHDLTLGVLVDRLSYRDIPIRRYLSGRA